MRLHIIVGLGLLLSTTVAAERPFTWDDKGEDVVARHGTPDQYWITNNPEAYNRLGFAMGLGEIIPGSGCQIGQVTYSSWVGPLNYMSELADYSFDQTTCRLAQVTYSDIRARSGQGLSSSAILFNIRDKLEQKYGDTVQAKEYKLSDPPAGSPSLSLSERIDGGFSQMRYEWHSRGESLEIYLVALPRVSLTYRHQNRMPYDPDAAVENDL